MISSFAILSSQSSGGGTPPEVPYLLLESGEYLLLEDNGKIIL